MEPSSPRLSDLTYRQLMQLVSPRFKTAAPELPATRHYYGEIYGSPDKDISPDFNLPKSGRPAAKRTFCTAIVYIDSWRILAQDTVPGPVGLAPIRQTYPEVKGLTNMDPPGSELLPWVGIRGGRKLDRPFLLIQACRHESIRRLVNGRNGI